MTSRSQIAETSRRPQRGPSAHPQALLARWGMLCLGGIVVVVTLLASALPADAQRRLPYIRDTEIERLLEDYSGPIFEAAGLGADRVRMRIIRASSFNAFVLDGRNVFMNTGTLTQAETPGEVIGVIAHEAGHIAGGHLAGLRAKIKQDQTRLLLMKILGLGALVAGAASNDESTQNVVGGIGRAITTGSDPLVLRSILSYRRVQESAADQAGISYLNATRQSARGMILTFERLADQELFLTQGGNEYTRSHPLPRRRIAQLRQLAAQSPYYGRSDPPKLQERHDLMRAKIAGYLDPPSVVFNQYQRNDRSLPARYAQAIATFRSAGIDAALPRVDALIAARPRYPYFHELKADFLIKGGRARDATGPLETAIKLSGGSSLMEVRYAQALQARNRSGDADRMIRVLRKALAEERVPLGYHLLAKAYWSQGREADAYLASAQAHFGEGNLSDAKRFAKRAQAKLRKGSPKWVQADDIVKFKR